MSKQALRILLVDDDLGVLQSLSEGLEAYGYSVDAVTSSEEAIRLVESTQGKYDVALIEEVLETKFSGLEVLRFVKSQYPETEVIVFTGHEREKPLEVLRAGAYRYLSKPIDLEELALTIRFAGEQRRARRGRSTLSDSQHISSLIDSALDLNEILQQICRAAVELLKVDHSAIVWFDLDLSAGRVVAEYPDREILAIKSLRGSPIPVRGSMAEERLVYEQEVLNIPDVAREPNLGPVRDILLNFGVQSILATPIVVKGQVIASIGLDAISKPRTFSADEIELCKALADQAAMAIEQTYFRESIQHADDLERIIASSPTGIVAIDAKGFITHINEQALTILGYEEHEVVGRRVGPLYADPKTPHKIAEELGRTTNGKITGFETSVRAKTRKGEEEGEEIPIRLSAAWLYNASGERIGSVGYFDDLLADAQKATQLVIQLMTLGDFEATLLSVVKGTQETVGCDAVVLYAYNEDTDTLSYPPMLEGVKCPEEVYKLKSVPADSIVYKMLREDKPYIVEKISEDPLYKDTRFARDEGIKSCVAIPLKTSGHKVGVMFVNYRSPHRFTKYDLANIELFANQAAVAIHNAQLYEQTQRRAEALSGLYQAGQAVSSSLSLKDTLTEIAMQALRVIDASDIPGCYSHVALVDSGICYSIAASTEQALQELRERIYGVDLNAPGGQQIGITGRVAITGETQNVGNVHLDKDYISVFPNINSQLSVPLKLEGQVIGVISIEHPVLGAFLSEDEQNLELLAAQAAVAVRTARLLDQVMRAQVITQIVAYSTTLGDYEGTLHSVAKGTREAVNCDAVVLYAYNEDTGSLSYPPTMLGVKFPERVRRHESVPADSIVREMLWRDDPYIVEKISENSRFKDTRFAREEGIKSCVAIPLTARGNKVGVMFINYRSPHHFTKYERTGITLLANQVAANVYNAQLYERAQRRAQALSGLYQARQALSSSLDLKHTLIEITTQALNVVAAGDIPGCFSHVALLEDGILRYFAASTKEVWQTIHEKGHYEVNLYEPAGRIGISGRAVMTGQTQNICDVSKDDDYLLNYPDVKSQLSVPLKTDGQVLGVISVEHPELDAFSDEDVQNLELMAAQAAAAVRTTQLQETAQIVAHITTLGNRKETLQSIPERTKTATGCDAVVLFVYDPTRDKLEHPPSFAGVHYPKRASRAGEVKRGLVYDMLERDDPYIVECVADDELLRDRRFATEEEIKSEVIIPLKAQGQKVGVMFVNYRTPHRFTEAELANIYFFADQAAIAIRNAQLFEDQQRRVEQLECLFKASRITAASIDKHEILQSLCKEAVNITGASSRTRALYANIRLYDPEREETVFTAAYPRSVLRELQRGLGDHISLRKRPGERIGITGRAIETGGTELASDVQRHPDYVYDHPDTCSEIAIPLKVKEEVIGVLNVEHPEVNGFDQQDRNALEMLATQAVLAIQKADQFEELARTQRLLVGRTTLATAGIVGAALTHSIVTETATIQATVWLMRDRLDRHILDKINEYLDKISERIATIFEVAKRWDSLSLQKGARPVSVNAVLRDCVGYLCRASEWPDLSVEKQFELPDETKVWFHPQWFKQAIDILIQNALTAMADAPNKVLTVKTSRDATNIKIGIADTGEGIPEHILPMIFVEPVPKGEGESSLGVGLMVAQIIIQTYGGEITVSETGPDGTDMTIVLPSVKRQRNRFRRHDIQGET